MTVDKSAMAAFIMSQQCRRGVMSEYLDGFDRRVSCEDLVDGACCDRCGEGLSELQSRARQAVREWAVVKRSLDDMVEGCGLCWVYAQAEEDSSHLSEQCVRWPNIKGKDLNELRQQIVYQRHSHSCTRCGISQKYCATGQDEAEPCQWPGVMVPVIRAALGSSIGREMIKRAGYEGEYSNVVAYGRWLGRRHVRRIWGEWMSNAMAVLIEIVLFSSGAVS